MRGHESTREDGSARADSVGLNLRILTIGVSIQNDIDAATSGSGNERVLKSKIDSYDAHCCVRCLLSVLCGGNKN